MDIPERFDKIKDPSRHRHESARMLIEILATSKRFNKAPDAFRDGVIIGIERGLLNAAVAFMQHMNQIASWELRTFVQVYMNKRNLLFAILKDMDNTPIGDYIMNREISWCMLAQTPVYKLRPDIYGKKTKRIEMQKNVELKQKFIEGLGKCKNCGCEKFKQKTYQKRASDEAASLYYICFGCNKRSDGMK